MATSAAHSETGAQQTFESATASSGAALDGLAGATNAVCTGCCPPWICGVNGPSLEGNAAPLADDECRADEPR
jgi:hypothetical protein